VTIHPEAAMTRAFSPDEISQLTQSACLLEVSAPKPGNVSRQHDFVDVRFEDFLLSAVAIGPVFARASGTSVGAMVLSAVEKTRQLVGTNTNLGIVLLLAPLARAAAGEGGSLRSRLSAVLAALTVDDARDTYAAIRLAAPGGLGSAETQDVREEPSLSLREVMALAAERDTIAREYVTDYDVTLSLTVPALREARAEQGSWPVAVLDAYLRTLAEVPDTLIARKEGLGAARSVSQRARQVLAAGEPGSPERAQAADAFDRELRGPGNRMNPGTTADLVAAALFVALGEEL
jgi:triphosphoribosyl-dephospho-CoA synthase